MLRLQILYGKYFQDVYIFNKLPAYKLYKAGIKVSKIGKILGVSRATIYSWIKQVQNILSTNVYERWQELKYH